MVEEDEQGVLTVGIEESGGGRDSELVYGSGFDATVRNVCFLDVIKSLVL